MGNDPCDPDKSPLSCYDLYLSDCAVDSPKRHITWSKWNQKLYSHRDVGQNNLGVIKWPQKWKGFLKTLEQTIWFKRIFWSAVFTSWLPISKLQAVIWCKDPSLSLNFTPKWLGFGYRGNHFNRNNVSFLFFSCFNHTYCKVNTPYYLFKRWTYPCIRTFRRWPPWNALLKMECLAFISMGH